VIIVVGGQPDEGISTRDGFQRWLHGKDRKFGTRQHAGGKSSTWEVPRNVRSPHSPRTVPTTPFPIRDTERAKSRACHMSAGVLLRGVCAICFDSSRAG
jgi:hypothetical protein